MKKRLVVVLPVVAVLAACSPLKNKVPETAKAPQVVPPPSQPAPDTQAQAPAKQTQPGEDVSITALKATKPEIAPLPAQDIGKAAEKVSPLDDPTGMLATRVIYFDYDSSDVDEPSKKVVAAHADYLSTHKSAKVTLEGHTDERGTREYNMALGDRRAQSVKQIMLLQGVGRDQVETVSYGEEQPADAGHDETAWGKNRRAEIVYTSR